MKLLGAALILCGAALQCHALLGARRQERAALRELSAALEGLERGIRASLMPLPRLLGQRGAGKYADAFFADVLAQLENGTPLPDGWREAAARTPLGEREQAVLSGLANTFGGEEDAVLRALRAAGGVPVVAHIFKYRFDDAQRAAMLAAAADAGALGVEVRYTTYTPEQTEIAQALAARFGLAPSGGSDYHGLRKPDIALGSGRGGLRVPYAYLAGLKALAGHECV